MKKQQLLRQFEFTIPASSLATSGVKQNDIIRSHLPLIVVNIDFEKGEVLLEGDWKFMMAVNRLNESSSIRKQRDRVTINTGFSSGFSVNLADDESDGLMWPLQGKIKDGDSVSNCIGLLKLDNMRQKDGSIGTQWDISLYIYDMLFDDTEIVLRFSICILSDNTALN